MDYTADNTAEHKTVIQVDRRTHYHIILGEEMWKTLVRALQIADTCSCKTQKEKDRKAISNLLRVVIYYDEI